MQRKLLVLSFIEGAAVMAAELCGAKLLAPIFGNSLYVWASVLGLTLVALALGYFYGGFITERSKDQRKSLFSILSLAALFLVLMPVISFYLVPRISYISFLPAVVLSTISLLFFPVFFLGATSPLFIVLQTPQASSAGKVSGTVYAVSTFGGIVATFLSGFYMIPEFGLNITLLFFGGILFICTLLVLKLFKIPGTLLFLGFAYLNLQFIAGKDDGLLALDGILGRLEVEDVAGVNGKTRLLKINNIIQSEMDLLTNRSVSAYVALLDTIIETSPLRREALVLGLGGGLTANLLLEKNYNVTGVEFDNRIIEAGKKYFFMNQKVESVCQDARYYLNHCDKKFDLVLFDVFKAEEQPDHVLTIESMERLKKNLNDSATVLINWHGYTGEKLGAGTSVLYNTLKLSGLNVGIYATPGDESHRNLIFLCGMNGAGELPVQMELHDFLPVNALVNTDNKPVLEKYNARANKAWRSNYLRYYQGI